MPSSALIFVTLFVSAAADVYMHNPRGSNNRNCERNDNRRNGNRLFDSQNNGKGGYACPRSVGGPEVPETQMHYYVGSILTVEWTAQHGCGPNSKVHCDIVLQYMCEDSNPNIRDGTPVNVQDSATDTIQDTKADITNRNKGMHETYESYQQCKFTDRNRGLFVADRQVNPMDARGTRQNNNGNRRGLECPEERDYYPYWRPTLWKDIAVLTADTSRCAAYKANSNNVKAYGQCVENNPADPNRPARVPITEAECKMMGTNFEWTEKKHDLPAPDCQQAQWSRANQLGNTPGGFPASYNWTIPNDPHRKCVLRLRYNISTGDYPGEDGLRGKDFFTSKQNNPKTEREVKYPMPVVNNTTPTGSARVQQDMRFKFNNGRALALATNTNQFGRTFQDRSYTFEIKARPGNIPANAKIVNLNVRGKRGNIVQAYPAVEYDFVPSDLTVNQNDYIHFQWEGSDYNPRRGPNNGEGGPPDRADNDRNQNARADRSNIVEMRLADEYIPWDMSADMSKSMFPDAGTLNRMAMLQQTGCKTEAQLKAITNERQRENDVGNCEKLNGQASPYFNGGVVRMTKPGKFDYFCTRNSNFSNRNQKATLRVAGGGVNLASPRFAGKTVGNTDSTRFNAFDADAEPALAKNDIGCFDGRVPTADMLPNRDWVMKNAEENSWDTCIAECRKHSAKYASVHAGGYCACSNGYGNGVKLPDFKCNAPCHANKAQNCGGYNHVIRVLTTDANGYNPDTMKPWSDENGALSVVKTAGNQCLTLNGNAVRLAACGNNNPAQQWRVFRDSRFFTSRSGKTCMSIPNDRAAPGSDITVGPCPETFKGNEQWFPRDGDRDDNAPVDVKIQNIRHGWVCLAITATSAKYERCTDAKANLWTVEVTDKFVPAAAATDAGGLQAGLMAKYFTTHAALLAGTNPVLRRVEPVLDLNWPQSPGPNVPADNFGVSFGGFIKTPDAAGVYTLAFFCDDTYMLFIDDGIVHSQPRYRGHITSAKAVLAASTTYKITIHMKEYGGGAGIRMYWAPPGKDISFVAAGSLFHNTSNRELLLEEESPREEFSELL